MIEFYTDTLHADILLRQPSCIFAGAASVPAIEVAAKYFVLANVECE